MFSLKKLKLVLAQENVRSRTSPQFLLRARRNEKEMKVKPATSFKLLTIFIHKKIRQDSKQNNVSKQYLSSLCHKVPQNNPQEFIKQILSISVSDPTI